MEVSADQGQAILPLRGRRHKAAVRLAVAGVSESTLLSRMGSREPGDDGSLLANWRGRETRGGRSDDDRQAANHAKSGLYEIHPGE